MNINVGCVTATLYKITFWIYFFVGILCPVSYTHLTLPTKLEV